MAKLSVVVAFLAIIGIVACKPVLCQAAPTTLSDILSAVDQHPGMIDSLQTETQETNTYTNEYYRLREIDPNGMPMRETFKRIWAFTGDKLYDRTISPPHSGLVFDSKTHKRIDLAEPDVNTFLYDGDRAYAIKTFTIQNGREQTSVSVQRRPRVITDNLLHFGYWIDGQWIGSFLRQGESELKGTYEDPRFGTLQIVHWRDSKGNVKRISLAPKLNWLATRVEAEYAGTHNLVIHQLLKAEMKRAMWFPVAGKTEARIIDGADSRYVNETLFQLVKLELNSVPASVFELKLPPGSSLFDEDTLTAYRIGANGERIKAMAPPSSSRAEPFTYRWAFIASMTTIIVLVMGAIIRWRQRSVLA